MVQARQRDNAFQDVFQGPHAAAEYMEQADYEMVEAAFQDSLYESGLPFPEGMETDPEWVEFYSQGVTYRHAIREMSPDLAHLSDEAVDEALLEMVEGMSEAELEGFFSGLKRFARRAAGKVARFAAPAIGAAGRMVGGVFGGPAGAAIGGRLGRTAGRWVGRGLTRFSRTGRVPRIRLRRPTRRNPVFNRQQMARGINQLSGILNSPQVRRALSGGASREVASGYGAELSDDMLDDVAEVILDLADQIEELAADDWI
ncbi:MAG: hypothetical protein AAFX02_02055 [Pseudomonadota bacterium]